MTDMQKIIIDAPHMASKSPDTVANTDLTGDASTQQDKGPVNMLLAIVHSKLVDTPAERIQI